MFTEPNRNMIVSMVVIPKPTLSLVSLGSNQNTIQLITTTRVFGKNTWIM